ncbi:MauE/DoxX family redox-associated membrane protein [Alkalibaculum bacchi]|uniref:MauE/DoxX family redox-associated membrane protein n=1 Tax=Alkalibaculum bacchi TaxID=645887 RepID=UPI0026F275A0|nr:MauE/DoxX family redox-associated membrane protein [Alkalibaculum bacchi]
MINIIYTILQLIVCLTISITFYSNGVKKIKNIYSYYKSFQEYNIISNKKILKMIVSMLISFELMLCIMILFPSFRLTASIVGMFIQAFYILTLILNYGRNISSNCGCFNINVPKYIDFKSVAVSFIYLYLFVIVLLFN